MEQQYSLRGTLNLIYGTEKFCAPLQATRREGEIFHFDVCIPSGKVLQCFFACVQDTLAIAIGEARCFLQQPEEAVLLCPSQDVYALFFRQTCVLAPGVGIEVLSSDPQQFSHYSCIFVNGQEVTNPLRETALYLNESPTMRMIMDKCQHSVASIDKQYAVCTGFFSCRRYHHDEQQIVEDQDGALVNVFLLWQAGVRRACVSWTTFSLGGQTFVCPNTDLAWAQNGSFYVLWLSAGQSKDGATVDPDRTNFLVCTRE